jgi:hypothetical protein
LIKKGGLNMETLKLIVIETTGIPSAFLGQEVRLVEKLNREIFENLPLDKNLEFYPKDNPLATYFTTKENLDIVL